MSEPYMSPLIGHEITSEFYGKFDEAKKRTILLPRMDEALAEDGFGVLHKKMKRLPNGGVILSVILSESHAVIYVFPDGEHAHYNLYSCLGSKIKEIKEDGSIFYEEKSGKKTFDSIKDALNPSRAEIIEIPVIIDEKLAREKYNGKGRNLSSIKNSFSSVYFINDDLLRDNEKLEYSIKEGSGLFLPNKSLYAGKTHTFQPQGATGSYIFEGPDGLCYLYWHSYPEHGSLYARMCNLDGQDVKKDFKNLEDRLNPRYVALLDAQKTHQEKYTETSPLVGSNELN